MQNAFGERITRLWRLGLSVLLGVSAMVVPTNLKASPITYSINQKVGIGSVTGSITTNGTIGTITTADITAWTLTMTDGTNTLTVSSTTPTAITQAPFSPSTDLTATLTDLNFNFGSTDGGFLILGMPTVPGSGGEVTWQASSGFGGQIHIFDINGDNIQVTDFPLSGDQVIASVGDVPEPGTLTLLGSALLSLGGTLRRHL